jgi:hypothetical protein
MKSNINNETVELSAYEQCRIDNIKRNNARLRTLGLISAFEERRSNAISCGINEKATSDNDNDDNDDEGSDGDGEWNEEEGQDNGNDNKRNKRKRKPRPKNEPPREGSRKSRRLNGENTELSSPDDIELLSNNDPVILKKEREERVKECREVRLRAANAIAACGRGAEEAARKNPTATYEHCLMRVKTMTEKGLMNRVKAIERAAGKHCVVKMAIFKSCLQDEAMWELAEIASDALERLKALKPIPVEEH